MASDPIDNSAREVCLTATQIGWTLWNISIGALFVGASMVLCDGSPFYPSAEGFLKMLFNHRFGRALLKEFACKYS